VGLLCSNWGELEVFNNPESDLAARATNGLPLIYGCNAIGRLLGEDRDAIDV
jgi:hypothetical protein